MQSGSVQEHVGPYGMSGTKVTALLPFMAVMPKSGGSQASVEGQLHKKT